MQIWLPVRALGVRHVEARLCQLPSPHSPVEGGYTDAGVRGLMEEKYTLENVCEFNRLMH